MFFMERSEILNDSAASFKNDPIYSGFGRS